MVHKKVTAQQSQQICLFSPNGNLQLSKECLTPSVKSRNCCMTSAYPWLRQNNGESCTSNCFHQYSRSTLPEFPALRHLRLLYKQVKYKLFLHPTYIKSFWELHTVIFLICLLRCSPMSIFTDCPKHPFAQTSTHILGACAVQPSRSREFKLSELYTTKCTRSYLVLPLSSSGKLTDGWEAVLLTDDLLLSVERPCFQREI